MMIYAFYDCKVESFVMPFFADSDNFAQRIVLNSFDRQSQLCLYPSDYSVHKLADLDLVSGVVDLNVIKLWTIKDLIPQSLRKYALDGSFGGVNDG